MNRHISHKQVLIHHMDIFLCIFVLLALSPLNVLANSLGLGPLYIPPLSPVETFRDIPAFVGPDDHAEGKMQISLNTRWTNVWAFNVNPKYPLASLSDSSAPSPPYGTFLLDMEVHQLGIRSSFFTSPSTRFEVSLPFYYIGGGSMDNYIENFHDLWRVSQHRRDEWPRNQSHLIFVNSNGERIMYTRDDLGGLFIGNLSLGGSWKIKDTNPAIALRFLASIPTANTLVENSVENDLNITLQSTASWQLGKLINHDGIGFTWYRSDGDDDLQLEKQRFSFMHTFEYPVSKNFSLILHGVAATPVADYSELDKFNVGMSFGCKKRWNNYVIELASTENMFFFNNSPDIGFHMVIKTIIQ